MNKKLFLLPLIVPMLLTACGASSQDDFLKDGVVVINDFETLQDLSLMKFPFPKHSDRGRFDLSENHVTSGEKSLKYTNVHGSHVEVCHYFDHIVDPYITVVDIKSIGVDIYNDSDFDSKGSFYIYFGEDMGTLLSLDFSLPKGELTRVSFPLSKLALEYNYTEINCVSLKLYTNNTDYNNGVGYTYYIDNWHANMGSEYTDVDMQYKPEIEDIANKIDALPQSTDITTDNEAALLEIARKIYPLPDLYRRAIPNIAIYKECLTYFYKYYSAINEIDYDRNTFLELDEFFGESQLTCSSDTKADIFYTEKVWPGESEARGCTEVLFAGGLDNKFIYNSAINLNDFDFVHFRVWNNSPNLLRIWFSYESQAWIDVPAGEVRSGSYSARMFTNQFYWAFNHVRIADGALLNSTGSLILDEIYVTGRSQDTLKKQLQYALDRLPSVESLIDEDSILSSLTLINAARDILSDIMDQSSLNQEQLTLLYELEEKVEQLGYGIAYNAYSDAMTKFAYGEDLEASVAVENDRFGYVSSTNNKGCPPHVNEATKHEQGYTFAQNTDLNGEFNGLVMYIYNPTERDVYLSVKDTSWKWDTSYPYWTDMTLTPGWNKVDIKKELIMMSDDRKLCILVNDASTNNDFKGTWLFSSLFKVPRAI